jgi:hypothetical protein
MQTQIKTYILSNKGIRFINIFGYATRGVPGLEINGAGKLSKNIKEKLIYLTRQREIKLPTKRFVICLDINDFDSDITLSELKFIEFPILLLFWYLAGVLPIKKLESCLCSGWFNTKGYIYQSPYPKNIQSILTLDLNPVEIKSLTLITNIVEGRECFKTLDSRLLLEHIPGLEFRIDYIDRDSAIPLKSFIA